MSQMMDALRKEAGKCADEIRKYKSAHVVSHIDADGLTSAGIICTALEKGNFEYTTRFVKQLDEKALDTIANESHEIVIFTDLGSGMCEPIKSRGIHAVISDHHQPQGNFEFHLNPHLFGANGSYELSGSGSTYLLASALGGNKDLSALAIVGAVGDMQHLKMGQLVGINREILEEGVKGGTLQFKKDLTLFSENKPALFISYCSTLQILISRDLQEMKRRASSFFILSTFASARMNAGDAGLTLKSLKNRRLSQGLSNIA